MIEKGSTVSIDIRTVSHFDPLAPPEKVMLRGTQAPDYLVPHFGESNLGHSGPGIKGDDSDIDFALFAGNGLDTRVSQKSEGPEVALGLSESFRVKGLPGSKEKLLPYDLFPSTDMELIGQAIDPPPSFM
jgi:hypothetical protein